MTFKKKNTEKSFLIFSQSFPERKAAGCKMKGDNKLAYILQYLIINIIQKLLEFKTG